MRERMIEAARVMRRALLAAAAVAVLTASGTASAASSCSDAILADWFDNSRIDGLYDLPCYEAAIAAIPDDIDDYTDAADVIARAFQSASGRRLERELEGPVPTGPPPAVTPPVDAAAASEVPVPLLVLGGMSATLLAAGGCGYLSRRRRERLLDD